MIAIVLLLCTVAIIYLIAIKPFKYWSKRHVKTGKFVPVFGNNAGVVFGTESFADTTRRVYNEVEDVRYYGIYQLQVPSLVLKSPELIKQICVKDFDHFLNHKNALGDDVDELWCKNLFTLKGQSWKDMRSILSPSFTSSKMKAMFTYICQNADLFAQHFVKMKGDAIEVEFKDAFTRYTNDVIASTAFGIHVDSLKDRENEFYLMGKDASNFGTPWKKFVFTFHLFCPAIASFLGLSLFGKELRSFFVNLVKDTIKLREEKNIKRSDMLGLLMEARKGKQIEETTEETIEVNFAAVEEHLEERNTKRELSDLDIASQVFIFFLGGFESVSNAMCFMAHELAVNVDVQMKLIQEIDENRNEDGVLSYETIANLTYLDMVVSESLRKWPVAVFTDRMVTKPYIIKPELPDETPLSLEVGDQVIVPIIGLHYDTKYFENPDKFIPERFSPENRKNINPYTYLPFGVGPRNCIGSRFALLEIKAVFFHILSHFEIVPVEKTNIPLQISTKSFNFTSVNGFPLGLKRRPKRI